MHQNSNGINEQCWSTCYIFNWLLPKLNWSLSSTVALPWSNWSLGSLQSGLWCCASSRLTATGFGFSCWNWFWWTSLLCRYTAGRNILECFLHSFSSRGFFTWIGNRRPNECCSHSDGIWTTIFFCDIEDFVTSLQLQQFLISVTGHCG